MGKHILQSPLWAEFKNRHGTPAVSAGNVIYTVHNIPLTSYNYAYCPRVSPFDVNFDELKKSVEEKNCIAVHFDVPNIIKGSSEAAGAAKIFDQHCVHSPRDEFAKANFFIDLTKSEGELFSALHKKHRYNINYAKKNGVIVRESTEDKDFDIFYSLYKETGVRQKFYFRGHSYLRNMWDIFNKAGLAKLLIAEHEGEALAAWILLSYEGVLYYPYGGSKERKNNLFASTILGWEALLLGKKLDCNTFDMWGASVDLNDASDEYYGFSIFKSKFGANHVVYIDSYDMVINEKLYKFFNLANSFRWKLLKLIR